VKERADGERSERYGRVEEGTGGEESGRHESVGRGKTDGERRSDMRGIGRKTCDNEGR